MACAKIRTGCAETDERRIVSAFREIGRVVREEDLGQRMSGSAEEGGGDGPSHPLFSDPRL